MQFLFMERRGTLWPCCKFRLMTGYRNDRRVRSRRLSLVLRLGASRTKPRRSFRYVLVRQPQRMGGLVRGLHEADRDDPGWRAADVFGPPGFSPAQPTLTNRVAAIAAKVSTTNCMNISRDEDVVALCALYPPTLRGDPGPDGQPALSRRPRAWPMKETVCENMLSPSYAPAPNRLRTDLRRRLPAGASPNEALARVRLLIDQLPVAKTGQWERPLKEHFSFLSASQPARNLTQIAFDDAIIEPRTTNRPRD